jgi:ATP-dependent Lon protease
MHSSEPAQLALFPLDLVLLPGEVVPLHIFEPRYLKLIAEVRTAGSSFGIVLQQEQAIAETGCAAALVEVIEELADGRLTILVEGGDRFHIEQVHEPVDAAADYARGSVVYFDDEPLGEPADELGERAIDRFLYLLTLMDVETPRLPSGTGPLSFRLASVVEFGWAVKQQLLESVSETDRLEMLVATMDDLIPRLILRHQRDDAIRGNGKGG